VRSRDEHLTWAKQRALIYMDMGDFTDAVAGLRADLAEHPLTKGVMSSDQAVRGFNAAMDAALGRGSYDAGTLAGRRSADRSSHLRLSIHSVSACGCTCRARCPISLGSSK
jgi:hypothetical protein